MEKVNIYFFSNKVIHLLEKMSKDKPDLLKGSFYANPLYDQPTKDMELINKYPTFYHPNIWPTEELPFFASDFQVISRCIIFLGIMILMHCDRYVKSKNPDYPSFRLLETIAKSTCPKARLLHYFPSKDDEVSSDYSSW